MERTAPAGGHLGPAGRESQERQGSHIAIGERTQAILATVPRWRDGDFVFGRRAGFQAWAVNKRRLNQRSGVENWRHHDLRRTVASLLGEVIGTAPHIVSEILGHARPGMLNVYNKADYRRQVAVALQAWASHVTALAQGEETKKIIPLRSLEVAKL